MKEDTINIETVKSWYIRLSADSIKINEEFEAVRKKREKVNNQHRSLEVLLAEAGVEADNLMQGIKSKREINKKIEIIIVQKHYETT